MNFLTLTSAFSVTRITNKMVADEVCEICIREDALIHLTSTQIVAIAKSLNSELKVNTKQSKESIIELIQAEMIEFPIEEVKEEKIQTKSGNARDICFQAFAEIDMNDNAARRALIDVLVTTHDIKKTVVQSYASNFRKAQK